MRLICETAAPDGKLIEVHSGGKGFRLADQHLSGNMQSLAQPADHVE